MTLDFSEQIDILRRVATALEGDDTYVYTAVDVLRTIADEIADIANGKDDA